MTTEPIPMSQPFVIIKKVDARSASVATLTQMMATQQSEVLIRQDETRGRAAARPTDGYDLVRAVAAVGAAEAGRVKRHGNI